MSDTAPTPIREVSTPDPPDPLEVARQALVKGHKQSVDKLARMRTERDRLNAEIAAEVVREADLRRALVPFSKPRAKRTKPTTSPAA